MDRNLVKMSCRRLVLIFGVLGWPVVACVSDPGASSDPPIPGDTGFADTGDSGNEPVLDAEIPSFLCDDVSTAWTRCGDSPTGLWRIQAWCADAENFDPLDGTCPSVVATGTGRASGLVQFGTDGEFIIRIEEGQSDVSFQFPLDCYGGSTAPCQGRNFGGVCELAGADGSWCACERSQRYDEELVFGTWVRTGSVLELRPDDSASAVATFCASDSGLTAELRVPQLAGLLPARMLLQRTN